MEYLDPTQINDYETQLARLRAAYGRNLAQLTYNQGTAQQTFDTNMFGQNLQFDRQRAQLPGSFAGRGLLNSGIYKNALSEYAQNRSFATGMMQQQHDQAMGQFTLDRQNLNDQYTQGQSEVYSSRNAARAAKAAQLRNFMQQNY